MAEIASFYGFTPSRTNMICCPFHHDKTASLKLYPTRWQCFGCNEGGDAIDFVRALFNLSFPASIDRISSDFGLGIEREKPDPAALARIRAERAERERRKEEKAERQRRLLGLRAAAWRTMEDNPPVRLSSGDIEWPDAWITAVNQIDYLDHLLDTESR